MLFKSALMRVELQVSLLRADKDVTRPGGGLPRGRCARPCRVVADGSVALLAGVFSLSNLRCVSGAVDLLHATLPSVASKA